MSLKSSPRAVPTCQFTYLKLLRVYHSVFTPFIHVFCRCVMPKIWAWARPKRRYWLATSRWLPPSVACSSGEWPTSSVSTACMCTKQASSSWDSAPSWFPWQQITEAWLPMWWFLDSSKLTTWCWFRWSRLISSARPACLTPLAALSQWWLSRC